MSTSNAWIVILEEGGLLHCEPQRFDGSFDGPSHAVRWSIIAPDGRQWIGPPCWTSRAPADVLQQMTDWRDVRRMLGEGD